MILPPPRSLLKLDSPRLLRLLFPSFLPQTPSNSSHTLNHSLDESRIPAPPRPTNPSTSKQIPPILLSPFFPAANQSTNPPIHASITHDARQIPNLTRLIQCHNDRNTPIPRTLSETQCARPSSQLNLNLNSPSPARLRSQLHSPTTPHPIA